MEYHTQLTYGELYKMGADCLCRAQIAEAQLDARLLLEWCCHTNRNTLLVHGERSISQEEFEAYADSIAKRARHIPLQYITGEQEFMGLTFQVNEHVLIPRQDTEILVEEVMRHMQDGMKILDMCTGSGCILLSLLHYSNHCIGVGADISEEALVVAEENARRIKEQKPDTQAVFLKSNLFAELEEEKWQQELGKQLSEKGKQVFDIIVSNPPYIRSDVIETLMPEVREHEPLTALDGKEDGLYFYRIITKEAEKYLTRGGMLFFEIGYDQGEAVRCLMEQQGYKNVQVIKDFAGLDRVVYGTLQ